MVPTTRAKEGVVRTWLLVQSQQGNGRSRCSVQKEDAMERKLCRCGLRQSKVILCQTRF
jgi:CDGSH-type Zn-finger protein